jgi:hypothetical protein
MIGFTTTNATSKIHESILFKGKFQVTQGREATGHEDGIRLITSHHNLIIRVGCAFKRDEWVRAFLKAYDRSEWNPMANPFMSGFPERTRNEAKWYVDGEQYYADVLESLKMA